MARPPKVSLALVAACLLAAAVPRIVAAQITSDGRFSTAGPLPGAPNYIIDASRGRLSGSNLFHSFGQFNLSNTPVPQTATFTAAGSPPGSISNVISRVTGGNPSSIDGGIGSTITGANLYLINPSGIVFGPHATVNISGSFHASTADYLKLKDGTKFQATNPDASSSTLSAMPEAFGFLTATPANITVNGSRLGVLSGQTLGLVARGVSINPALPPAAPTGAALSAPAGTIHVTSVAGNGTGEVPVDPRNVSTVTSFGPVDIRGGSTRSTLTANTPTGPGSGGSVFIRSGALTIDFGTIAANNSGSGPGGQLVLQGDNQVTLRNGASVQASASGSGGGTGVTITGGSVLIDGGTAQNPSTGIFSTTSSTAASAGRGGTITIVAGQLTLRNGANVLAGSCVTMLCSSSDAAAGPGGDVAVSMVNSLTISSGASLGTVASGTGNAGKVSVNVSGIVTIDMLGAPRDPRTGAILSTLQGIGSFTQGTGNATQRAGNAGNVGVTAGALAITNQGLIISSNFGTGNSGDVSVNVSGMLSISGRSDIMADSLSSPGKLGDAGKVTIAAGALSIDSNSGITSNTFGAGKGGSVFVRVDNLLKIDNASIASNSEPGSTRDAGDVTVTAGDLSLINGGQISSTALPSSRGQPASIGSAGQVTVTTGTLSIRNAGMIASDTSSVGSAGGVAVTANSLTIAGSNSQIESTSSGAGRAGNVSVDITGSQPGALTILTNGSVRASTSGAGEAGSVVVHVAGGLMIDGTGGISGFITGISSQANPRSSGNAGGVTVNAGSLSLINGGLIVSNTFGSGTGGTVSVTAGTLSLASNGAIVSNTFGAGKGGRVSVTIDGQLTIDNAPIASNSEAGSTGNAGDVTVTAGSLSIVNRGAISSSALGSSTGNAGQVTVSARTLTVASDGLIASSTEGTGSGGNVSVTAGSLMIAGGDITSTSFGTGFGSGRAGNVSVDVTGSQPGALTILGNGVVRASTFGPGDAGSVAVRVAGGLSIDGAGANPGSFTGISSQANPGSTGNAGEVSITAGTLSISNGANISTNTAGPGAAGTVAVALAGDAALSGGALITSATTAAGNGGTVTVSAQGALTLTDPGTGIIASASKTAGGNAGSVTVAAPQIALMRGGEISSTTAGTGMGGSVIVTTPGALVLNGAGDPSTQIATSAIGPQSGAGGSVSVSAGSLTVEGGAQIASSTAGPGKGGDVNITVASDIVLPDPGPQINAQSTGSGNAGSITVSAVRLLMNDGAKISTEAETSTANGGNITLHVRDFLYLVSSEISTSVKGETGNGGNIKIDPQLVILDHSLIKADAIAGHGGNITINAGQFIPSSDSSVEATSELGISGTIVINGPRVDVNGALVVLSSQLRGRTEVLREACAARADRPISSLVEAGRGGLPQDPEATLPALYIAGRDLEPYPQTAAGTAEASGAPLHTTARLTMRCG